MLVSETADQPFSEGSGRISCNGDPGGVQYSLEASGARGAPQSQAAREDHDYMGEREQDRMFSGRVSLAKTGSAGFLW